MDAKTQKALSGIVEQASGGKIFRSANRATMSVTLEVPNTDANYKLVTGTLAETGLTVDPTAVRGRVDQWTEKSLIRSTGKIDLAL